MVMEKIYFDEETFIWKTKLNLSHYKLDFLNEVESIIVTSLNVKQDGFSIISWKDGLSSNFLNTNHSRLNQIIETGISECREIYLQKGIDFNKINTEVWINRIRHKNPVQKEYWSKQMGDDRYHTHTSIHRKQKIFHPDYTFVYYIQMPDIMYNDDGVLYFKSKSDKEYWVRPEEDDLIIMEADMPHFPSSAPDSTKDRIVVAGSVGFDFIKKNSSFI